MSRVAFACLLFGISVSSVFLCNGMNEQLGEVRIMRPSLPMLCKNFRAECDVFEQQTKKAVEELKKVSGDNAVLLSYKLQKDLRTVSLLRFLVETCKRGSDQAIKPDKKQETLQICRYLTGVMPYAGKMQDVISSVLNKEFGVNSICELEAMAK